MIIHDTHVHSRHSEDCETPLDAMCRSAVRRGVSSLTFTEHVDWNPADKGYGYYNHDRYRRDWERCRDAHADRLSLYFGVEISEPHLYPRLFQEELRHSYDLVIGSLHMIDDKFIGDRRLADHYSRTDLFERYYRELAVMAVSGGFDVLAHLDLPARYWGEHTISPQLLDSILTAVIDQGIVLEINSSGFSRNLDAYMPQWPIARRYIELGGEAFSLGSDAHAPQWVGNRLPEAAAILRRIGGKPCYFIRRRKEYY